MKFSIQFSLFRVADRFSKRFPEKLLLLVRFWRVEASFYRLWQNPEGQYWYVLNSLQQFNSLFAY